MSSIFTISAASSARDFWKTLYDRNMMTDCVLYVRNTHQQGGGELYIPNRMPTNLTFLVDSIHDPHQIYREYRCHRLLLAGHSQFFRQCFLSTTSSTTPTVVLLDSIESHIFESIVHLIYTGVVEVLDKDREAFQKAINTLELIDFGVGEPRSESTGLVSFESNDFTTSQVKRFKLDDNSMKPSLPMHYSPDNNDQVIGNPTINRNTDRFY